MNPLFGPRDCDKFVSFLKEKSAFIDCVSDENDQTLTKLIFVTTTMQQNYRKYNDVVLIETIL